MQNSYSRLVLAAGILVAMVHGAHASDTTTGASTNIVMLPPTAPGGGLAPCLLPTNGAPQVLFWSGTSNSQSAINCVSNFTYDPTKGLINPDGSAFNIEGTVNSYGGVNVVGMNSSDAATTNAAIYTNGSAFFGNYVGFGTSTPDAQVDIVADLNPTTGFVNSDALHIYYGNLGHGLGVGVTNNGGNIWMGGQHGDFAFDGGTDSVFWLYNTGTVAGGGTAIGDSSHNMPNLWVGNNANVGVNTNNPQVTLDVNGTMRSNQINNLSSSNNFITIIATLGSVDFLADTNGTVQQGNNAPFPNGTAANGGTSLASCPSGYSLVYWSLISDLRTNSGTNGWPNGTVSCSNIDGNLQAKLWNYSGGSTQTSISCSGLCVRN